uniref:SecA_7 protein n=1 Tax=Fopius arisanus TaxID=64838 RepID=A0A0C9QBQ1_9HYME
MAESSEKSNTSNSQNSEGDNPKPKVWGENIDDHCPVYESGQSVDNKAEKRSSDSTCQLKGVTIKDLVKEQICPIIEVEVSSVHPMGLLKTSAGRDYLPFTVVDATGSMMVMAWAAIAAPLSEVLQIGQTIRIIKGNVQKAPERDACRTEPVYRIALGAQSRVEILLENGETCIVNPIFSQNSVPIKYEKGDDPPMKKISMTPKNESKISDLTYPHTFQSIKLHVKSMITDGVALTAKGFKYVTFVGTDETGDISCVFFEPHSYAIGPSIREGVYLQIERGIVETLEEAFQIHCKNNHQIKVLRKGNVKILEEKKDEPVEPVDRAMKVADLKAPQICKYIELKVKSLVTKNISLGCRGKRYHIFIGEDSTGEIGCTIFEPHGSIKCANALKVGSQLALKDALVISKDARIPIDCDNDFEIIMDGSSAVTQLDITTEKMEDDCSATRLENFNELQDQAVGSLVDVIGVIGKSKDDGKSRHSPGYFLTLLDESTFEIPLFFENEIYVDSSWTVGTIIEVTGALVGRGEDEQMQLVFLPERSTISIFQSEQ